MMTGQYSRASSVFNILVNRAACFAVVAGDSGTFACVYVGLPNRTVSYYMACSIVTMLQP